LQLVLAEDDGALLLERQARQVLGEGSELVPGPAGRLPILSTAVTYAGHRERAFLRLGCGLVGQDRRELALELAEVRGVEQQVHREREGVRRFAIALPVARQVRIGQEEERPRAVARAAQLWPILPLVLDDREDRVVGRERLKLGVR